MKVVAIVQARTGSTRLPGKVLRDLCGKPMLARVLERLRRATRVDEVLVATSTLPGDDAIADFCAEQGWRCFRGSESDVLDRYARAAHEAAADVIVRITADCPLIDPGVVDEVVAAFLNSEPPVDYACNFHPARTFPRGLDAEVFSREVLDRCAREVTDPSGREHVTSWIYRHPEQFRLTGIASPDDQSAHRWTVDTPEDFALVQTIYSHFGHDRFTWREVLAAFEAHPEWAAINQHIEQKAH